MARNQFAIERPRKISISIQGYDASERVRNQQKRQSDVRRRLRQKAERGAGGKPAAPVEDQAPAERAGDEERAARRPSPLPALAPREPQASCEATDEGPTDLERLLGPVFTNEDCREGDPR